MRDRDRFRKRFGCYLIEGYGQSEGGAAINPVLGMPKGALGQAGRRQSTWPSSAPRRARSARRPSSTTTGGSSTPARPSARSSTAAGAGKFEGYYRREDAEQRPPARRLVLDRRPRLRRRGRLLLLRRPDRRLAPRRLGELRGRSRRGGALAPPRPGRRGGLPGPRHGVGRRRPGHGRARDGARDAPFDPDAFAAWLDGAARPGSEVAPPLRAGLGLAPPDGHRQGDQGGPADRGVGVRRSGLVAAARDGSDVRFEPLRDDDRAALAAGLAENGRPAVG